MGVILWCCLFYFSLRKRLRVSMERELAQILETQSPSSSRKCNFFFLSSAS
jgi:hypothetical protein